MTTPAYHFEEINMAKLVSIVAELYKFVSKISLHEENYALKQRLSFTEKRTMRL